MSDNLTKINTSLENPDAVVDILYNIYNGHVVVDIVEFSKHLKDKNFKFNENYEAVLGFCNFAHINEFKEIFSNITSGKNGFSDWRYDSKPIRYLRRYLDVDKLRDVLKSLNEEIEKKRYEKSKEIRPNPKKLPSRSFLYLGKL